MGRTWPKKPKMALISEYLAADLSLDASADALAIINIGNLSLELSLQKGLLRLFYSIFYQHLWLLTCVPWWKDGCQHETPIFMFEFWTLGKVVVEHLATTSDKNNTFVTPCIDIQQLNNRTLLLVLHN